MSLSVKKCLKATLCVGIPARAHVLARRCVGDKRIGDGEGVHLMPLGS